MTRKHRRTSADLAAPIPNGRSLSSICSDTETPPEAEQKGTLAMLSRCECYASPTVHEQTVSEARDAWRNEGNPN